MADPFAKLTLILHPSDLSGAETSSLAHALRLSVATGAELHLLNVAEGLGPVAMSAFPHVGPLLDKWRCKSVGHGLLVSKTVERDAPPADRIQRFVEYERPDLVVLSPHQRHGLARLFHASVSEAFAGQALVMTLFVPRDGRPFVDADTGDVSLRRIVVPVASSPTAERAIAAALGLGRRLGCSPLHVTLLHVGAEKDFPNVLVPAAEPGVTVDRVSQRGGVVEGIVALSKGADLIVMTTEGRVSMVDHLRGDTTENVLRQASCPVLAVPVAPDR